MKKRKSYKTAAVCYFICAAACGISAVIHMIFGKALLGFVHFGLCCVWLLVSLAYYKIDKNDPKE